MRQKVLVAAGMWLVVGSFADPRAQGDRVVAWTTASEAALERELNGHAARGLRVAAVSDGLPCALTVLQAPERPAPPATYRVVADRDVEARLEPLVAEGFSPRLAHRRTLARAQVIFERAGTDRPASAWRLIEFGDLNALQPAIAAAAAEGFQARLLVRYPFKSWPGMSERGMILASRPGNGKARETHVVIGQSSNIDAPARAIADAASQGFSLDLLFTGARDGSPNSRRERLVALLSRESGAASAAAREIRLERSSSFGTFGSGVPLGVAPYWDNHYVYAWSPAERRQTWASPVRLSANEATCAGLPWKLRLDAPRDLAWTIVGLAARKLPNGAYELVYVTDQRIGPGN